MPCFFIGDVIIAHRQILLWGVQDRMDRISPLLFIPEGRCFCYLPQDQDRQALLP